MSANDSLSRTIADTVTLSRELREEGQIDGQVKLYNVDDESEFESDAGLFFERTMMTEGLQEALTILRDSLTGEDPRGTHILYGPYGSGKSHQMVALYHCFAAPGVAGEWGTANGIKGFDDALPADGVPITVAMQNEQYEYLWEPFFEALDADPGTFESGGYPDMDTIEDAVGDRSVVFLVDELEDWFDTLSGDRESANRGFLQALLEATALDDLELYTVVSVLREGSKVHNILNREQAVEVNMNSQVDKREILHHRLVESVDETAAREIVDGYVDTYEQSDHVDVEPDLRESLYDLYPFHPTLLDALETRYYADEEAQNTRGMIYLFSKTLLECQESTDLLTHGDIDVRKEVFQNELTKINRERVEACYEDIVNRIDGKGFQHGPAILNTILLYSMRPNEGEGAERSEIVVGAYETGDLVSDIVLDLEQLHGVAWHLHKLNGKYAIRSGRNPTALIRNAASDVSERSAKAEIADFVSGVFGSSAYPVGFRTDDVRDVPDNQRTKVVVRNRDWDADSVEEVITNEGRGREWRNTLVFVQPEGEEAIESGSRAIEKARYIEGARQVLSDESLDEEIRDDIREKKEREVDDLENEITRIYGEVIDGDDLLEDFGRATPMKLEDRVQTGAPFDAGDIADAMAADKFDLQAPSVRVVEDLFDRRGEASIEDVYAEFLRKPTLPMPGDETDVLDAVVEALADEPVLAHDSDGFHDDLTGISLDAVLVPADTVEDWDVDKVEQDLRQRFGSGTTAINVVDYEIDLLERTDVRLVGDDGHEVVLFAVGRLANESGYALYRGDELLEKPQSDAELRDVSEATRIGAEEIHDRVTAAIEQHGEADLASILRDVRGDESVYLPADETDSAFREAVTDFLVQDYLLKDGYRDDLDDDDPTEVTLVPTVDSDVGERILDYIEGLDEDEKFTVGSVADQFAGVSKAAVKSFLLQHLGRQEEPKYVINTNNSDDPGQWMPGYEFVVEGGTIEVFKFGDGSVAKLREAWEQESPSGTVVYGDVTFDVEGRIGVPGPLQGAADVESTGVSMTLTDGQSTSNVRDLVDRIPDSATNIHIEVGYE